ncbi:glycosyltransferase family A protein [Paenibacillus abyssi]|uniref:Uncharacterized protein n=1 Tax=Paenibacillus abyssi TaxID=1340531 RepID=A0A917CV86_9BACL|nr:glycosyltransferase family A protein [Paenibacillus abyssi]GGF98762.1 hypothetical protein GCM10010916_15030 [Paenibacillus abyssi]
MADVMKTPEALLTIKEHLRKVEVHLNQLNRDDMIHPEKEKHPSEIVFAISLKSKTVSKDWDNVQASLAKTLRSILRSTDQHFRIIIAGHEMPKIRELRNKRVTWLPVDFPPPKAPKDFSKDKMRKRKEIGVYLRKARFTGYFMPLDADDWIHHRFVEYIRSQPYSEAFIIKKGCMVNLVRKEVWLRKHRFYIGCGSSAVFHFKHHDFPRTTERDDVRRKLFRLALKPHSNIDEHLEEADRRYVMVELPLVTWVLGHGDNTSVLQGKKDDGVSAKHYGTSGEKLTGRFYRYFKVNKL